MRNILFRGKCIKTGKWVFGNYLINMYGDTEIQVVPSMGCDPCVQYSVHPNTIGQYTGLGDCTGEFIFENDVVLVSGEIRCDVIFFRGSFYLVECENETILDHLFAYESETCNLRVIGKSI